MINLANGLVPLLIGIGALFVAFGVMYYFADKWDKKHPKENSA